MKRTSFLRIGCGMWRGSLVNVRWHVQTQYRTVDHHHRRQLPLWLCLLFVVALPDSAHSLSLLSILISNHSVLWSHPDRNLQYCTKGIFRKLNISFEQLDCTQSIPPSFVDWNLLSTDEWKRIFLSFFCEKVKAEAVLCCLDLLWK